MSRRAAIWALGALLGIVVTAAITWATSRLTGQHIGLSSEPLSAGRSLAPRFATAPARRTTTTTTGTRTRTARGPAGASPSSTTTVVTQTRSSGSVEVTTSSPRHARDDGGSRGEGGAAGGGPGGGEGRGSGGRGPDD